VERVSAALADLARRFPGGEILVIAHAGVLRVMRRRLGVVDSRIANLGGCEFIVRPDAGDVHGHHITAGDLVDLLEHGAIGEEL